MSMITVEIKGRILLTDTIISPTKLDPGNQPGEHANSEEDEQQHHDAQQDEDDGDDAPIEHGLLRDSMRLFRLLFR